jgi:hypothetical protein
MHSKTDRKFLLPYERQAFRAFKLKSRALAPDTPKARTNAKQRAVVESFLKNGRFLPYEHLELITWHVMDDAVWFAFTAGPQERRAFVRIASKDLADSFEAMFDESWERGKP